VSELVLSDVAADKLKGEFMDLAEGMAFVNNMKIKADTGIIEKTYLFRKLPKILANFPLL
jgi:hypothetical protein